MVPVELLYKLVILTDITVVKENLEFSHASVSIAELIHFQYDEKIINLTYDLTTVSGADQGSLTSFFSP